MSWDVHQTRLGVGFLFRASVYNSEHLHSAPRRLHEAVQVLTVATLAVDDKS